jgi:excisionase family DNA binding protein
MEIASDTNQRQLAGPNEARTYTVDEAARMLRIGRNQAYQAAKVGQIPTIRIGKRLLVPRAALDRMLAGEAA